jgi:hypothetical protein
MITIPREKNVMGKAIASVLSHPFGVGNSYFRIQPRAAKWVDTVFGGCYRRDVFNRIGTFNERLVFSQDLEFNLRLKRAGGKILLLPSIVSFYFSRSDFSSFWRHNIRNGEWVIMPMLYTRFIPVSIRHLVPLFFLLAVAIAAVSGFLWPRTDMVLFAMLALYAAGALGAAIQIAVRESDLKLFLLVPFIFLILHVNYGIGSFVGVVRVAIRTATSLFVGGPEEAPAASRP